MSRFRARFSRLPGLSVAVSAGLVLTGLLAACSSGSSAGTAAGTGAADTGAGSTSGSAAATGTSGGPASGRQAFPVTIKNTFGETTIPRAPRRIVTLGWNAQDVVYALGETPTAMPRYTYGATAAGIMPWDEKYYDADRTTLLDTADGPPYEAIAAVRPDVILAPYEGFDKATYQKLSAIAPTVAYPGKAWQTSWQDQTSLIGQALGKSAEATALIAKVNATLASTAAAHPEFAGKSLTVAYFAKAQIDVYMPTDPRVQMLGELGFSDSAGVRALAAANSAGTFFATVSWEKARDIDADVIVGYVDDMSVEDFGANKVAASLGAVQNKSALVLSDQQLTAGLSQPTVLSVDWTLAKILPSLSAAASNAAD